MKQKLTLTTLLVLFSAFYLQAQTSKVNVTIDGPGVVDEYYLLGADGSKQLKLKAVPSKFLGDVTFDGWSGDATGTATELTVAADKAQNIHAKFTYHRPVKKYPLLNLKQSWADMGKPLYYEAPGVWETENLVRLWRGTNWLPVDYNLDGYLDIVEFPMKGLDGVDNNREKVRFWLGKPDGSFDEDPKNDNRITGTVYSILMKYADFNNDGYPDFCSYSSGYDRKGTTGDYPVVLMSGTDGVYTDLRYTDFSNGCFHGGTTGDFDNDGDIDVLFWNMNTVDGETSLYLENDGQGNFVKHRANEIIDLQPLLTTLPSNPVIGMDVEVIDLNNDNYNDLIFCGHDHLFGDDLQKGYCCMPFILWGDSSGKFTYNRSSMLPEPRLGYGISCAFCFYDFNDDGVKEIIVQKSGDGLLGSTKFYREGYLQVCELVGDHYVDKTEQYIPVENATFNAEMGERRLSIENLDGTDYLVSSERMLPYVFRNGKMEPLNIHPKTKVEKFEEGFPLYVDGPGLTDFYFVVDGINEVDLMPEHGWVDYVEDSGAGTAGNLWRINLHHRKDTHFGRTCIRWNRAEQKSEDQNMSFHFNSDIDFQKLADQNYYLEFFIKNADPDLTLNLEFTTYEDFSSGSRSGVYIIVGSSDTHEGKYTNEWQRMLIPLSKFKGEGSFSKVKYFGIRANKGDLKNEFYLDDIRIRKLPDSGVNDYDRAFMMGYLDNSYMLKERTKQVGSQEFKAMLKPLIQQFASDSIGYFNRYITDYDVPLTRGMATCMAYYVARSIGAEKGSPNGEQPADIWEATFTNYDKLLPHWQDPGEEDAPEDKFWRGTVFGGWMTASYWNFCHVSDHSGINVIALDKEANEFHWDQAFTWEDAVCAITRLLDSIDPNIVQEALVPVTVTAKSYTIKYGDALPKFEYTSEGATIEGTPTISCEATSASPVGTYPIVITKGSVTHYNTTFVNGTLTIEKTPLKITAKSYTIKQGEDLPTFEATYEGFKNNETSAVLTKQPTITTTATSASAPGEYEITISGAEAQNYEISYVAGKLTIEAVEIVPISETEEKSFSQQVDETTDLQNTVIDNTYYNMDAANGDGYDATEQALVLNSTTSSAQMSAIQGAQVGDAAVRENFSGIIFELPAGKGVVTVDAKTIGTHVLNVQIGNGAPTQVKKSERGTVEVEYNVSAPTYVYLYASTESGASARLYRGPSAGANSVLLYGYKVQVGGTGIGELKNGKMEELKYYDLNGRKVKTPRKGVYIINGKKVVVK